MTKLVDRIDTLDDKIHQKNKLLARRDQEIIELKIKQNDNTQEAKTRLEIKELRD